MIIRTEMPADYPEVYALVKASFETTSFSDGTEPDYLNEIRARDTFIPELSLVAVDNGKIVGQIVMSKMQIDTGEEKITQLVISPLSVLPSCFHMGIGSKLVAEGCKRAKRLGYKAVFLCGSSEYYTRFGFIPSYKRGIYHVDDRDKNADWCLVLELEPGSLKDITGTIDIE